MQQLAGKMVRVYTSWLLLLPTNTRSHLVSCSIMDSSYPEMKKPGYDDQGSLLSLSCQKKQKHISLSARWTHGFDLTTFGGFFSVFHTSSCASRLQQLYPHFTAQLGQLRTPAALKPVHTILSITSHLR